MLVIIYSFVLNLLCLNIFFMYGRSTLCMFHHFNLNNTYVCISLLILLFGVLTYLLLSATCRHKNNLIQSTDFLFSVVNIIILLPQLFYTNTVFCFLFFLELVSLLLLYKLLSSKVWYLDRDLKSQSTVTNKTPSDFLSMIFFQYWVTFFSTIFIVYFYLNVYLLYGSTEWYIIQYISGYSTLSGWFNNNHTTMYCIVFILAVLFKLGVAPFHLFKIEVYKGLPYLSIFFYTTFYLLVFILFFINVIVDLF